MAVASDAVASRGELHERAAYDRAIAVDAEHPHERESSAARRCRPALRDSGPGWSRPSGAALPAVGSQTIDAASRNTASSRSRDRSSWSRHPCPSSNSAVRSNSDSGWVRKSRRARNRSAVSSCGRRSRSAPDLPQHHRARVRRQPLGAALQPQRLVELRPEKREIRFTHTAPPHRLRSVFANPLVARLSEARNGFRRPQSVNKPGSIFISIHSVSTFVTATGTRGASWPHSRRGA